MSFLENVRCDDETLPLMIYSTLSTCFCLYVYTKECEYLSKREDLRKIKYNFCYNHLHR